jgi:hypothetical protein
MGGMRLMKDSTFKILLLIVGVLSVVGLYYAPGQPWWNYAGSHDPVDGMQICGWYYENLTVASTSTGYVKDRFGERNALFITGTDGILRETGPEIHSNVQMQQTYSAVSIDLSCGREGHQVFTGGIIGDRPGMWLEDGSQGQ